MRQLKNKNAARSWHPKKKKAKFSLKLDFHRDKNKKRKQINKRAIFSLFGVLSLLALFYLAIYSDNLRIKTISVSGNENVDVDKMQTVVRGEMSAKKFGFIPGDNSLFLSKEKIKAKLIETFSEMETVDVSLKFPNEIVLKIKEKNTALIWCRNQCYFVNDYGVAFLQADEGQLIKEQKNFIKVIEEVKIAEETEADRATMRKEVGEAAKDTTEKSIIDSAGLQSAPATTPEGSSVLPAITLNERVSDESFITFAVEISRLVSHNSKLKIKYFKTKGYHTRELIGFTDKNTRLYFDTTKSAEKQAKNLDYLLSEVIDRERIDTLQYIYLKNEDRVFYK